MVEEVTKLKTLKECEMLKVDDIMKFRYKMKSLGFADFEEIHYKSLIEEATNIIICLYYPKDLEDISDNIFECILNNITCFANEYSDDCEECSDIRVLYKVNEDIFTEVNNKIEEYINSNSDK